MSICFQPYIHDPAHGLWTAPPATRDDRSFELSLSNANGIDLLCALGLPPAPHGGPIPIDAFSGLVTAAARRHLGRRSPELVTVEEINESQVTLVRVGRSESYMERRLGDLMILIQRSLVAGATHFGWG